MPRGLEPAYDIAGLVEAKARLEQQVHLLLEELDDATDETEVLNNALHDNDRKFRRFVETSLDGILLTDERGFIIEWNAAQEAITGQKRDDVLDRPLWDVLYETMLPTAQTPEAYETFKTSIQLSLQTGAPDWSNDLPEFEIMAADGNHRFVQTTAFVIPTQYGVMLGAINRDVTTRRNLYSAMEAGLAVHERTQRALIEANSRLQTRTTAILNNISDSIILTYADGSIDMTNHSFERQFLFGPDELFNRLITAIAEESHRDRMLAMVKAVAEDGQHRTLQFTALRRDGSVFDAEVAMARVIADETNVICSVRDISHLKEVERMKTRFITTVSHELRTPITTMLLGADNLHQYYERMGEDRRKRSIDQLHMQAKLMAELVEAILDISRVESRQNRRGTENVELNAVLSSVLAELQTAAEAKELTITVCQSQEDLWLMGDRTDFKRIWRNLISNAIKYTPEGGTLTVRLGQVCVAENSIIAATSGVDTAKAPGIADQNAGIYVLGQVEDTGHGIGQEDLSQLFTRFYRGWANGSNIPGTGLGLSLVKELLSLYEGNIAVISQLNIGSTFSFWLPASI